MKTILKLGFLCAFVYVLLYCTGLLSDKAQLNNDLIRMHVVANSDSEEDQAVKLQVKDAIVSYLQPVMEKIPDKAEAYAYIQSHLKELEAVANQVLAELGESKAATVSLTQEEFDVRQYDTFSLPSGIYDSLRVVIGEGEGKNWWCVAFPTLCIPATTDDFADTAVSSGFSDSLTSTLRDDSNYQIRFYFLDLLGKLEILFH